MAESTTTSRQARDPEDPPAPPAGHAVAPWQVRCVVWFDWVTACFMAGLAIGQLRGEWASRADLTFLAVAIPVLLLLGEGLRRRVRWARVPQLLVSAGLTLPGALALGYFVRHGHAPSGINAVIGGVLVFAALAAAQLVMLLRAPVRRWLLDPRPAPLAPRLLVALAVPALGIGVGLQAVMAANLWSARAYGELGIRLRMPNDTAEKVTRRRDEAGTPFDVHVLLGTHRLCSYAVTFGRLPPAPDGVDRDPAVWREAQIRRITGDAAVLSRTPFAGDGRFGVGGEEVRFQEDRVGQIIRVFSPLPRFVVMVKACYRREPPEADGFFDSLAVEPR
jgi:hypothetical protein